VGPTDLAADLTAHGREDLDAAIDRTISVLAGAGHSIGLPAPSVDGVRGAFARGADRVAIYWERQLATVVQQLATEASHVQPLREEAAL
jgi:2-keto-3-deoxy-L-rhamnonate aldolase RhmA